MEPIYGFMLFIAVCTSSAFFASKHGRSWFGFFALSFVGGVVIVFAVRAIDGGSIAAGCLAFLSPVLSAVLAGSSMEERPVLADNIVANLRKCPYCAEDIRIEAVKCRHCGSEVVPIPAAKNSGESIHPYDAKQLAKYQIELKDGKYQSDGKIFDSPEQALAIGSMPTEKSDSTELKSPSIGNIVLSAIGILFLGALIYSYTASSAKNKMMAHVETEEEKEQIRSDCGGTKEQLEQWMKTHKGWAEHVEEVALCIRNHR